MTGKELQQWLKRNDQLSVKAQPEPAPAQRVSLACPTEHDEQVALFAWADAAQAEHPELSLLFAIPNGGARHPAIGGKLKAEGVRAGVPDVMLACRRGQWGGLFIEMKRADHSNGPTPEQAAWIEHLRRAGYMAIVAFGFTEAQRAIVTYLAQP